MEVYYKEYLKEQLPDSHVIMMARLGKCSQNRVSRRRQEMERHIDELQRIKKLHWSEFIHHVERYHNFIEDSSQIGFELEDSPQDRQIRGMVQRRDMQMHLERCRDQTLSLLKDIDFHIEAVIEKFIADVVEDLSDTDDIYLSE